MSKETKKVETEVEAKVEAAPVESLEEKIAKAVSATMIAMRNAERADKNAENAVNASNFHSRLETCNECKQKRSACKGKHKKVVVLPNNPEAAEWFRGVCINGVWYLSAHANDAVVVPFESDVEGLVSAFERNELETRLGRKKLHYSGTFGGQINKPTGLR